jgi:hypothetical protein
MSTDIDAMKAAVVAQMRALGLTPDDLTTLLDDGAPPPITVAEFIDTVVWKALSPGDRSAYGTPLRAIKQGLPGLCSCTCDACMDHFRGNSTWTPCPCRTTGRCTCRYRGAAKGKVAATSCDTECPVLGDRPLRSITTSDWIEMGFWAQARAAKRTESRNRARSRAGRALFDHDGRNAVESLHGALSKIYTFAIDTVPGVNRNLTEKLNTPERAPTGARAYSSVQLEELWSAIVTSGGNDTELDMLIVWFLLETGLE